jgi:hypothetical protein
MLINLILICFSKKNFKTGAGAQGKTLKQNIKEISSEACWGFMILMSPISNLRKA